MMLYSLQPTNLKVCPASDLGIQAALKILREGGVVAHATETCYGLACDLKNPEAVGKLFTIKRRPGNMPVSALFSSIAQAREYLEWNDFAEDLAQEHLPGPLTIILKQLKGVSSPLLVTPPSIFRFPLSVFHFPLPRVGVRISPHPTAMRLVEMFGAPLSTTSANVHGKPNPYSVEEIVRQYKGMADLPDMILDDGPLPEHEASTVIDVSNGSIHVLRQGSLRIGEA